MKPVARLGDATSHGGTIVTGSTTVTVDGKPVVRMGDVHVCPLRGHGLNSVVTGSARGLADGQPIAALGDQTACGAIIVGGSTNAMI